MTYQDSEWIFFRILQLGSGLPKSDPRGIPDQQSENAKNSFKKKMGLVGS